MRSFHWRSLLLALSFTPAALLAQGVLVAPPGIFIDHRTRGGAIELYNPGNQPAEVSISFIFGYPVTDSLGQVSLRTIPDTGAAAPSASHWIEAFPRRLRLGPQERQTVRLLATPPASLPDGEYWARVVVEAKGGAGTVAIEGQRVADSSGIQVGLTLDVRTIVALLYRKGKVQTGVTVTGAEAHVTGDSLVVRARFERQGNAAFLGRVHGTLTNARGAEVASFSMPLAVYYVLEPRLAAPAPNLPPGRYVVHLLVDTERDDVRPEMLLPIAAIRDSIPLEIASRTR